MIDYNAFHNYLVELVGMYRRTGLTKGMSDLARRHHCTAVTKDQFYQMRLDKLTPEQVTPQLSRVVRDTIGKSDAKAALRESIGALSEGILAGSRISQGSDRTVQITITQPVAPAADCQRQPQNTQQPQKVTGGNVPAYRPGQVVLHRQTGEMYLVSRLLDGDSFTYKYRCSGQAIDDTGEAGSFWMGDGAIRPAKGNEVARFLGALTRSGYEWRADNANGLFFVTGRSKPAAAEGKPVEVFANDLPNGYHGIYALPAYQPSPYRFALRCVGCIDNAADFMSESVQPPVVENAILRQLEAVNQGQGCDGIREYLEYDLPTLCCAGELREHRVAFVKVNNNGTSYWLARDRDVLRLLSWISFIV